MEMAIRRDDLQPETTVSPPTSSTVQTLAAFRTPTVKKDQPGNAMEALYSMSMHLPTCTCQTKCPWVWARLSSPSMRLNGLREQVDVSIKAYRY